MSSAGVRRSEPRLRALPPPGPERAPRAPRSAAELSVVQQVRVAFRPRNRLAALVGLALGGLVPVATYFVAHRAADLASLPALLAVGGLAFSAPTVYGWARAALGSSVKAAGFVVLLEGVMVSAGSLGLAWLGWAALGYLVAINAVATAVRLARGGAP